MADCHIAGLNIRFEDVFGQLERTVVGFDAGFDRPDITVRVTRDDIAAERAFDSGEHASFGDEWFEPFAAFRCLGNVLPRYNGVVMHGCLIQAGEKGILFTARSGTGKTTHMMLWQKLLGDRMNIVNGDKPVMRFLREDDRVPFGYGTPWAGKEGLRTNTRVGLTDVCLIERATENETVPLSKEEGFELLMRQTYLPPEQDMQEKTGQLIKQIAAGVRFWKIRCNMDISAAETAYRAIFEGQPIDSLPTVQNTAVPQTLKGQKVLTGVYMPTADTEEFTLSDLPFEPVKVVISNIDTLTVPPRDGVMYCVSFEYDKFARKIPVMGIARTETVQNFAVARRARPFKAVTQTENSFSVRGFSVAGKTLRFAAGKKYIYFVSGE